MTARFWLSMAISSLLAAAALAGGAPKADAPRPKQPLPAPPTVHVTCDFIEISATKAPTPSIDPKLGPIEKKLRKAPFTAWNYFKQLASATRKLEKEKTEAIALKQGSTTATLEEIVDTC